MIRAYYKDNPQQYKDFEDFLFLFPARHNLVFDFGSDTIFIDNEKFTLSKVQFIADNTEDFERFELKEHKNQPEGYAGLDSDAKIPPELLPPIRVVDVHVVQTLAERDALTGIDEGDLAVVVSEDKTYVWTGSEWLEIRAQGSVLAVEGRTGNVTLSDLFAAKDHEHSYIRFNVRTGETEMTPIRTVDTSVTSGGIHRSVTSIKIESDIEVSAIIFNAILNSGTWSDVTVVVKQNGETIINTSGTSTEDCSDLYFGCRKVSLGTMRLLHAGDVLSLEVSCNSGSNCLTCNGNHVESVYNAHLEYYLSGSTSPANTFSDRTNIARLVTETVSESKVSVADGIFSAKDQYGDFEVNKEIRDIKDTVSNNQGRIVDLESFTDELDNNVLPRLAKNYMYNTSIEGSEYAFLRIAKTTGAFAIKFLLIENNMNYPTRPVEITLRHASRSSADQNWSGDFPTGYLSGIQEIGVYDGGDGYWYVMPVAPPLYVEDIDVQVLYSTMGFEYVEVPRGSAWTHLYSLVST